MEQASFAPDAGLLSACLCENPRPNQSIDPRVGLIIGQMVCA
jgi:hypothetical protein